MRAQGKDEIREAIIIAALTALLTGVIELYLDTVKAKLDPKKDEKK